MNREVHVRLGNATHQSFKALQRATEGAIVSILIGFAGLPPKTKLDLLKERFIRGEITSAEYDAQKNNPP
jgi:hypothetical protein